MKKTLRVFAAFILFFLFLTLSSARAHVLVYPKDVGLNEGDLIRQKSGDPDVYIVNARGYKRLILSPKIFSFYGHLGFAKVKEVESYILEGFPTSSFVRDCETNDYKVYAMDVTEEDDAALRWANISAKDALAGDPDFFESVFCVNKSEFNFYKRQGSYDSFAAIPAYSRGKLPKPSLDETAMNLTLPPGYKISLFTDKIGPLRFMAFSPDNILFVSMPATAGLYARDRKDDGAIFALPDKNKDGKADEAKQVLSGLHIPHGIAFHNNYLYIAEEEKIARYPYLTSGNVGAREVVFSGLPGGGDGHVSRTIGFGQNGKMYVSIGSFCNACEETDEKRATIMELDADGSGSRIFARGLRNSVGFVFHPTSGEIWATENGRDYLGDDLPPDEINIIRDGKQYGWPYCYGKNVIDTQFSKPGFCETAEKSLYDVQAHSATIGLRFIQSGQFPQAWWGDLFVAYRGSWNRTVPTGYKVARLDVEGNAIVGEQDFITGWLRSDGSKTGRPVDVIFGPDGELYISDDQAKVIYIVKKI